MPTRTPEQPPTVDEAAIAEARQVVASAEAQVIAATAAYQKAQEDAEAIYAREHAAVAAWHEATALANHDRHEAERIALDSELDRRRQNSGPVDHTQIAQIETFTVDGATHQIVAIHGLMLGHKGVGVEPREANRYHAACGLSIDAPHDELVHDRFIQATPDCTVCQTSLAAMERGEAPDRRSECLQADEHIALVRVRQAEANQQSSG